MLTIYNKFGECVGGGVDTPEELFIGEHNPSTPVPLSRPLTNYKRICFHIVGEHYYTGKTVEIIRELNVSFILDSISTKAPLSWDVINYTANQVTTKPAYNIDLNCKETTDTELKFLVWRRDGYKNFVVTKVLGYRNL